MLIEFQAVEEEALKAVGTIVKFDLGELRLMEYRDSDSHLSHVYIYICSQKGWRTNGTKWRKVFPANNGAMGDRWIGVEVNYLELHKATIWTDIN